jgi:hypothetical protein
MDIQTIVTIITAVVAGSSVILKVVAPLTENKIDDRIQEMFVKILKVLSIDSNYDKDKVKLK